MGKTILVVDGTLASWKKNASKEELKHFCQEGLILAVTEEIFSIMQEKGITKVELAQKLGCNKSHITQLLTGSRNMTLRTLASIACELGMEIEIKLVKE